MASKGALANMNHASHQRITQAAAHLVTKDGVETHLTPTEFELLRTLAVGAGKVLTRHQHLARVWGDYAVHNSRQLRVYITYLRRKLQDEPAAPQWIITEPGIGYRLRPA